MLVCMSLYVCISCKAFTVSLGIFELGPDNRSRQDDGLEEAGGLNGSGEPGLKAYASGSFRHFPDLFRPVFGPVLDSLVMFHLFTLFHVRSDDVSLPQFAMRSFAEVEESIEELYSGEGLSCRKKSF